MAEEEATPTAAEATPVTTSEHTQESEEEKVAEETKTKPSVREQGRTLDQAEAEVVQSKRRRLGALMQQISTAQSPKEGSSEETAYYRYRLNKFEDTLDNLIKSFDDDEEVQGNAQDINSLMELLVAGEQVEMVGSETHAGISTRAPDFAQMPRILHKTPDFLQKSRNWA